MFILLSFIIHMSIHSKIFKLTTQNKRLNVNVGMIYEQLRQHACRTQVPLGFKLRF